MPAIYRLKSDSLSPKAPANNWGWHRATELLEAINNILASQGKKAMTALQIGESYKHIVPWDSADLTHINYSKGYLVIDQSGRGLLALTGGYSWLERAVCDDQYIPAKLGMRLIDAVKHPIRNRVIALLTDPK